MALGLTRSPLHPGAILRNGEDAVEFRVLGPVGIWRDGRSLSVVGQKPRTLLAVLVLNANRVVSHERLLRALWGNEAPASGRRLLHNHLWSLRRLLADADVLASAPSGYSLRIPCDASDLGVFTARSESARAAMAEGNAEQAAERFRAALDIWQGPALSGTHPAFQSAEGPALEERRTIVLAERIEADLAAGRASELIGELRKLVTENPLNEKLRAQLMLALHREGRTAEALEEYRLAHQQFRRELGLEPGDDMARLHQAILSGDPALSAEGQPRRSGKPAASAHSRPVPRQLPPDIARFTGREESLRQLDLLLPSEQGDGPTVAITVIAGTAGVGKTALATHWGHRVSDRFPDGQLYVNLHGYSQEEPMTRAHALRRLLSGLGVTAEDIPHEADEQEALYRSLVTGKRILMVFDNAMDPEQVRPLLPGSSSCRSIVTSRNSLRGLSVTHDVRVITLDALSMTEARALLIALLGRERSQAEADAVSELAELCGYLPLALRLAAAHLVTRPDLPLGAFNSRLSRENRLTALDIEEDPHIGVRAAFELSYRTLPGNARRAFRLIGLAPGPDIGFDGVVALTGMPPAESRAVIETLVGAHLIGRDGDRLSMHDLVRVYACDRGEADDRADERYGALSRLFDWALRMSIAAMEVIQPGRLARLLEEPLRPEEMRFKDKNEAWRWLDVENHFLISAISYEASQGWQVHAWKTARVLSRFFDVRDRVDDWLATHRIALSAAQEIRDRRGEVEIAGSLAYANMFAGKYEEYLGLQRMALAVLREMGDRRGEARALSDIGYGLLRIGRIAEAVETCREAVRIESSLDVGFDPGSGRYRLAIAYIQLGRFEEALGPLIDHYAMAKEEGERHNEAYVLVHLGEAHSGMGDSASSLECLTRALSLGRELKSLRLTADALNGLGRDLLRQGRYPESRAHYQEALLQARQVKTRELECEILVGLGSACLLAGDEVAALGHYETAASLSSSLGYPYYRGLACKGMAEALVASGQAEETRIWLEEASAILAPMGVPEADAVTERLRALWGRTLADTGPAVPSR
ncbi:BTAD domain-containing putative transcriptional regulator [Streptosporangium sp. NPDC004379]|uniref:AfsR/SARP family transcriptional regulator n=1 Tax=Streptosporangium sp. NPDC004379 TaxID=3366189 RepID=UPI0036845756